MQILSPQLQLVKQIPIPRPNTEALSSPSYISCLSSKDPHYYSFILTGKKLLYSLEIEFYEYPQTDGKETDEKPIETSMTIQYKLQNFQKKGKKSQSYSAGLMINDNSVLVGDFEGALLILDKREKYLVKLNEIHLDAVHHLQKINAAEFDKGK
jgi:outer membrane protein assembly factor BamB